MRFIICIRLFEISTEDLFEGGFLMHVYANGP